MNTTPAFIPLPFEQGRPLHIEVSTSSSEQITVATAVYAWTAGRFAGGYHDPDQSGTVFGFVIEGPAILLYGDAHYELQTGMYFSLPLRAGQSAGATFSIKGGKGILVEHKPFYGMFMIGGPVEESGRLRYIDGCTDSLIVPPIKMGDPCLNVLFFPPGTDQTPHTHPSLRAGVVIAGCGECITLEGKTPLVPGQIFVIPTDALHSFRTTDSPMTVVAYHPDSDYGPRDEDHPMVNRTYVDGVSAADIEDIRTR